jgi:hypothetical protein
MGVAAGTAAALALQKLRWRPFMQLTVSPAQSKLVMVDRGRCKLIHCVYLAASSQGFCCHDRGNNVNHYLDLPFVAILTASPYLQLTYSWRRSVCFDVIQSAVSNTALRNSDISLQAHRGSLIGNYMVRTSSSSSSHLFPRAHHFRLKRPSWTRRATARGEGRPFSTLSTKAIR